MQEIDVKKLEAQLQAANKRAEQAEQQVKNLQSAHQKELAKHKQDLNNANKRADDADKRYNETVKTQVLTNCARENGAYRPEQIVQLLQGRAAFVAEIKDGKETGKTVLLVDGRTPADAVQRLVAAQPNLFKENIRLDQVAEVQMTCPRFLYQGL